MQDFLIFTDLDGTLLDHSDYSFSPASKALSLIKVRKIPLILATSKTFSEVIKLQEKLGIKSPFIVENGAGIFVPSDCVLAKDDWHKKEEEWIKISQAKSYLESRLFLKSMQEKYSLHGFGDLTLEEVAKLTGLNRSEAKDAMKRDFTEPFVIKDPADIPALTQEANALGFDIVKGGRFFHLITKDQDKAKAMQSLTLLYEEFYSKPFHTIALGDSNNDFTMLEHADHGIQIPKNDGTYEPLVLPNLIRAPFPGPKGWNTSILGILDAN